MSDPKCCYIGLRPCELPADLLVQWCNKPSLRRFLCKEHSQFFPPACWDRISGDEFLVTLILES
jgi:hypothetical protein